MIFKAADVSINSCSAIFGETEYDIDEILFANVQVDSSGDRIRFLIAMLALLSFLLALDQQTVFSWVTAVILVLGAIFSYYRAPKVNHFVVLTTKTGKFTVTPSIERETALQITAAIEMAMIMRGRGR